MKLNIGDVLLAGSAVIGICNASFGKSAINNDGLDDLSTSMIAPFSEKFCDDHTLEICRNNGGHYLRYSVYDPFTGSCVCSTKPSEYIVSKKCPDTTCLSALERVYYWPSSAECFCETEGFLSGEWNTAEANKGGNKDPIFPAEHYGPVKDKYDALVDYLRGATAAFALSDLKSKVSALRIVNEEAMNKRQVPTEAASAPAPVDTAVPTFIPPPKTDINPQLVNESLQVQPQNKATVSSVIFHPLEEVITFLFQMDGFVADSIPVNASTSMACGTIGTDPEPDIQIVPKFVQYGEGAQQTLIADCRCIAVNMYDPNVIYFYVQNNQGKIFSLTGSNKIVDINKLDTSQQLAVNLVSIPAGSQKRDLSATGNVLPLKSRQILSVTCGRPCPFAFMDHVESKNANCGCVFRDSNEADIYKRGITAPDMYSATMTQAACDAIVCHNNGGKPAMFNPYSATCWCVVPPYIENIPSGWTPST